MPTEFIDIVVRERLFIDMVPGAPRLFIDLIPRYSVNGARNYQTKNYYTDEVDPPASSISIIGKAPEDATDDMPQWKVTVITVMIDGTTSKVVYINIKWTDILTLI